jgi:hypothetical protein
MKTLYQFFVLREFLFLRQAAMERERELEHRAVDASTALVRIQVRQNSWIGTTITSLHFK